MILKYQFIVNQYLIVHQ